MRITESAPIDTLLEAIGQNLNDIRLQQNISNEDLSEKAGVSRMTLSKLWKGDPVKFDTLLRVVRALGRMDLLSPLIETPEPTPMERLKAGATKKNSFGLVRRQRASKPRKPKEAPVVKAKMITGGAEVNIRASDQKKAKLGEVKPILKGAPIRRPRANREG